MYKIALFGSQYQKTFKDFWMLYCVRFSFNSVYSISHRSSDGALNVGKNHTEYILLSKIFLEKYWDIKYFLKLTFHFKEF